MHQPYKVQTLKIRYKNDSKFRFFVCDYQSYGNGWPDIMNFKWGDSLQ